MHSSTPISFLHLVLVAVLATGAEKRLQRKCVRVWVSHMLLKKILATHKQEPPSKRFLCLQELFNKPPEKNKIVKNLLKQRQKSFKTLNQIRKFHVQLDDKNQA